MTAEESASNARPGASRPSRDLPGGVVTDADGSIGPLAGVRVLELGTLIAGPAASFASMPSYCASPLATLIRQR